MGSRGTGNAQEGAAIEAELTGALDRAIQRISEAGYKVTAARRALVDLILRRSSYFSAADIWEDVQNLAPGVGRATVFRTLDLLTEMQMVGKIHVSDGYHPYVVCQGHHHHHMICSNCGTTSDFDECTLNELLQQLEHQTHFRIRGHWLEVFGVCESCQQVEKVEPLLVTV